ncbi:MAG: PP2C family protein-serine/threonine phosphatase [bacterium]
MYKKLTFLFLFIFSYNYSLTLDIGHYTIDGTDHKNNEDRSLCYHNDTKLSQELSLFAVFDGHNGSGASEYLAHYFLTQFKNNYISDSNKDIEKALKKSIQTIENNLLKQKMLAGSTLACVLYNDSTKMWHIVHVGDSRIAIYNKNKIRHETKDHSPRTNSSEYNRVMNAEGLILSRWFLEDDDDRTITTIEKLESKNDVSCSCSKKITKWYAQYPRTQKRRITKQNGKKETKGLMTKNIYILTTEKAKKCLAMSRSIGDLIMKFKVKTNDEDFMTNPESYETSQAIIATPEFKHIKAKENDIIIIASDGFWDAINTKEAQKNILELRINGKNASEISSSLCAKARDMESFDDITVMVIVNNDKSYPKDTQELLP